MIDVADLPLAVQRAVAELPTDMDAERSAVWLRQRAASSWQAISGIWPTGQWHQVHEQIGLVGGYLTAASRVEEEDAT